MRQKISNRVFIIEEQNDYRVKNLCNRVCINKNGNVLARGWVGEIRLKNKNRLVIRSAMDQNRYHLINESMQNSWQIMV